MASFPGITSPAWSPRTRRTAGLVLIFVIGVFAWRLADMWPPVVVSLVLAYLMNPVVGVIQRAIPFGGKNFRRTVGTVLAFLLAAFLIIAALIVLVPAVVAQIRQFGEGIPTLVEQTEAALENVLSTPITLGTQTFVPLEVLQEQIGSFNPETMLSTGEMDLMGAVQALLAPLATPVLGAVGTALSAILNLIFVLTMIFYLMKDGPIFINQIEMLTPEPYRSDIRLLLYELGDVWNAYLRGQLLLSLVMGVVVFFAATILGLRSPMVLGLISALLEFIPNLGPALALLPAALFALFFPSTTIPGLQGLVFMLVVVIVWTGLQNLEAIFLVPRIMGDSLDLHPFVVIVAVIGGAALAGALGVILAAPVVASLRVFGQYLYAKLFGQPLPRRYPVTVARSGDTPPPKTDAPATRTVAVEED